jgi:hypothetical protein
MIAKYAVVDQIDRNHVHSVSHFSDFRG